MKKIIFSFTLIFNIIYSIKCDRLYAASRIPHFWLTPYLRFCQENNNNDQKKSLISALKEISGSNDCQESFNRLIKAKSFVLINKKISSLSLLEEFTQLEQLYLSNNEIDDLSVLSHFTHLEILFLSGNKIIDLTPISFLPKLKILYLSDNQINSIAALENLSHLKELVINRNPIILDKEHCPTDSTSKVVNSACTNMKLAPLINR